MEQKWTATLRVLDDVINKLPEFVKSYYNQLKDGTLVLFGSYYLGTKYDLTVLDSSSVCNLYINIVIRKVREKVMVDNTEKEFNRLLMISDLYFCLFDQERWNKNNLNLLFWSNIRAIVTIKKFIKGDSCRFFWKQKNKKVIVLLI
jgi:hypothetical protein